MQLELSDFVEGDLDEIAAYIAEDSSRRAIFFPLPSLCVI